MTEETKRYIAISDIVALKFICKNCGATTTRPLKDYRRGVDERCGNCNAEWADKGNEAHARLVDSLVNTFAEVSRLLEKKQFDLMLEIPASK